MPSKIIVGTGLVTIASALNAPWLFGGPHGYVDQSELKPAGPCHSATNAVAQGNGTIWFAGTVNGGVWRTNQLLGTKDGPKWVSVTDDQPVTCAAISAIAVDAANQDIVVAGYCKHAHTRPNTRMQMRTHEQAQSQGINNHKQEALTNKRLITLQLRRNDKRNGPLSFMSDGLKPHFCVVS